MRTVLSPLRTAAMVSLAWAFALAAFANPTLLRDINTTALRPSAGTMLTPATTSLQMSIRPVGSVAFFTGSDATHGFELWKTDGTAAGTTIVRDINPAGSSFPNSFVDAGGTLFFVADDGSDGLQLWKSDGTAPGTVKVSAFGGLGSPAITPSTLRHANGLVFFLGLERAGSGAGLQLWRSDGTAAGTFMLARMENSSGAIPTVAGSRVFFAQTSPAHGVELWTSDGTVAGTQMVLDINPGTSGSNPASLVEMGGILYFAAFDPTAGNELWRSDGTAAGTYRVVDIAPGFASSGVTRLAKVGSTLYFLANGATGLDLWASDGTAAGTAMVYDTPPGHTPVGLIEAGGMLYLQMSSPAFGIELWRSDGTAAGTFQVHDINPGTLSSNPAEVTAASGVVMFAATDVGTGTELWRTDGTPLGTARVLDIQPGVAGSGLSQLVHFNGVLLFSAEDVPGNRELWRSDGTSAGTFKVVDLNPAFTGSSSSAIGVLGSELLFGADDGVNGFELWKTDGTPAGTVLVKDINPGSAGSIGGSLSTAQVAGSWLFAATDGVNGSELWKSDGTTAGTVMVKDINPGAGFSFPQRMTDLGGVVLFTAGDGVSGNELWRTDGTAAGTFMVRDINPGAANSNISTTLPRFPKAGGRIYFTADDGTGAELWSSDGTAAGTVKVIDLSPGPGPTSVSALGAAGSWMMFTRVPPTAPSPGALGSIELWRTDGSAAGTTLVRTFVNTSGIFGGVEYGGALYLVANDGVFGTELWRTDGTPGGTVVVSDVLPGINGGLSFLGAVGPSAAIGLLWFPAIDGVNGNELWRSDGTAAGTFMVGDINAGPGPSAPRLVGEHGGVAYFAATHPADGLQLYRSDGSAGSLVRVGNVPAGSVSVFGMGALPAGLVLNLHDGVRGSEPWIFSGAVDATPDAFAFAEAIDVLPGTVVTSAPVTPTGYSAPAPVNVSAGEYSLGCSGVFTNLPGMLTPGQSICVRHVSSPDLATTTATVLDVGGTQASFASTTVAPAPGGAAADDVNGDGRADFVWVDAAGNVVVEMMDGNEAGYSVAYAVAPGAVVGDIADFDGDGRSDLLILNADGTASIAYFEGTTFSAPASLGAIPDAASLVGAANVDGLPGAEIVWHSAGQVIVWSFGAATSKAAGARAPNPRRASVVAQLGGGWSVGALGDVDGDGAADLVATNAAGVVRIVRLTGAARGDDRPVDERAPARAVLAGVGDTDGDRRAELFWLGADGAVTAWRVDGARVVARATLATLPTGASILRIADVGGDGRADLVVRLANGELRLWSLSGFSVTSVEALPPPPAGSTLAGR